MRHEEKMQQITHEAKVVGISLLAIILFWVVAGFGVSTIDVRVAGLPLWAVTGCVGTWLFASGLAVWLSKCVFKDFAWEDEDDA